MRKTKNILLCAGGTGGHLFPALAVAEKLKKKGWNVHLATDERTIKLARKFSKPKVHLIESASPSRIFAIVKLIKGYWQAHQLLKKYKMDVVVGFGGYPSVPPVLAAIHRGIKTVIHEQNARMGRANKFLSGRVNKIAGGMKLDKPLVAKPIKNFVLVGNPLRKEVYRASKIAYPKRRKNDKFNFFVFGGSQGAQFLVDIIEPAFECLPDSYAKRIKLTVQAKKKMKVKAEVKKFFDDMPRRMAKSHLIMCRAGAGAVSELAVIGRPAILVPLPNALDDDQGANAKFLVRAKASVMIRQNQLTPKRLAKIIKEAMDKPSKLNKQAKNAKKLSINDATDKMSELIESVVET